MENAARVVCLEGRWVGSKHFQRRMAEGNHFVAQRESPHGCPDPAISIAVIALNFLSQILLYTESM